MTTQKDRIFVAGHRGMVGSAIVRTLIAQGIDTDQIITRTHAELDLCDQQAVHGFFTAERPTQVYLAAARVGGIHANNTYPADFIYENIMMQANVIHSAHLHGVQKLLFLGSNCLYPKHSAQPITENALMTGPLEPTNEPYAVAKIAGIKLCESYNRQHGRDYRSIMPTNLYGPGDNYHPENCHVIPALIQRFHIAKTNNTPEVSIWGSGTPRREFLYVDDMARAGVFVMNLSNIAYQNQTQPMLSHINVGFGSDVTISDLASKVARTVGYTGRIAYDTTKPDGTPRKLMDSHKLCTLGWTAAVQLEEGLALAYNDFLQLRAAANC